MSDDDEGLFPVRVATSESRGRDYAATRALAAGELVLRVAPLAAVPTDASATSACSGCFRQVSSGLAPPVITIVMAKQH
jgi:hypothetical protein